MAGSPDRYLLPELDDDSRPFWEGCGRGELLVPRCASCGRRRFPPRPLCPWCRSFDVTWDAMSGRATVWSYVIPHPPLLPAYSEQAPYNVVVVTLDDDPTIRMVGNIVTGPGEPLNAVDPHSVEIGESVEVVFDPVDHTDQTEPEGPAIAFPRWVRR